MLTTSMPTEIIHQILVKNLTKPVSFCWPLTFAPMENLQLYWHHCSFHFKLKVTQPFAGL